MNVPPFRERLRKYLTELFLTSLDAYARPELLHSPVRSRHLPFTPRTPVPTISDQLSERIDPCGGDGTEIRNAKSEQTDEAEYVKLTTLDMANNPAYTFIRVIIHGSV